MRNILCMLLLAALIIAGGAQTVRAQQDDEAERIAKIQKYRNLLKNGNEDAQAEALFQLDDLQLPPADGIPLFAAHLQRKSGSFAEAIAIHHALDGLSKYGTQARSTLPVLIRLADEVETRKALQSYSLEIWWPVTHALSKIGAGDSAAIHALMHAVKRGMDDEATFGSMAGTAAMAIGDMGRSARIAAPRIALALYQFSAEHTWGVAIGLVHVTAGTSEAVTPIVHAIQEGKEPQEMAKLLGEVGPPAKSALPTLRKLLENDNVMVTSAAYKAIAQIAGLRPLNGVEAMAYLNHIDRASLPDTWNAFNSLKDTGAEMKGAANILARIAMKRKESCYRGAAIETLAVIGPQGDREAAEALALAAQGGDPVLALTPKIALGAIGASDGAEVAETIAPLLETKAKQAAAEALVRMGSQAAPATTAVIRALRAETEGKPISALARSYITILQNIGPAAAGAKDLLADLILRLVHSNRSSTLLDPNTLASGYNISTVGLLVALGNVGAPDRIVPVLQQLLAQERPELFAAAAHAAGSMGPRGAALTPLLLRAFQPDFKDAGLLKSFQFGYVVETTARLEAIKALGRIGPGARAAIPALEAIVQKPETKVLNAFPHKLDFAAAARTAIESIEKRPAYGVR